MTVDTKLEPKRLLIVDDEPAITKMLKAILTRAKFQVATCGSGEEALRMLSQGPYDLIVTDAIMPEMSGFDLARAIRRNPTFQGIPILMLTRKSDRSDVKKALEAGVTDYVIKPIDESLLIDKVEISLKKSEKEHRLRQVMIHGAESFATANLQVRIISLRESGMVVRFPIPVEGNTPYEFNTPIFKQIGIAVPILKMTSCDLKPAREVQSLAEFPYEAEFSFVGISEAELMKIRAWLQKQEIQRKK